MAEELGRLEALFTADDRSLQAAFSRSDAGFKGAQGSANAFAASTNQAFQTTSAGARDTAVALAQTARTAASTGRGIEALFRGNLLSAMRSFSIASRTAFNPNGPLAFVSGVNAVAQATKESQVLVTQFSSVLGSAARNAEGALNKNLFTSFGITAERALLNPSLAAQKLVAGLARIESAEERAIAVSNIFGASTGKILPIIESQIAAQQQQVIALSLVSAAEERRAIAQAQLLIATEAATSSTTGDVLATEGLAAAEAEATAATRALEEAQAELAAVQGEVQVASGLSAGAIGLMVIAAGALIYGLIKLFDNEKQVIQVTKEQIDLTEQRIALVQQELVVLEKLRGDLGDETSQRQALIDAKKRELADNLADRKFQENEIVKNVVKSLEDERAAYADITKEQIGHATQLAIAVQTQGQLGVALGDSREELGKSQKALLEAARSVDIFTAATGVSKEEMFAAALAHARDTDAAGKTTHAYSDLVHVLGLTIDAEGRLVPSFDSATAAINRQTDALRRSVSMLEAQANLRDQTIRTNIEAIANMGVSDAQAKSIFSGRRKESAIFEKAGVPSPWGNLDSAININQRVSKLTDTLNDIANPPEGRKKRGGGAGAADSFAKAIEEAVKAGAEAATSVWRDELKRQEDILKQQLENNKVTYENYYKQLEALQQADIDVQLDKFHEQLDAQTNQLNKTIKSANRTRIEGEIQKTLGQITVLENQRADVSRNIENEKNQAIERMEREHQQKLLQIQEQSNRNLEERQKAAIQNGLASYVDAENARFNAEKLIFAKRIQLANQDLLKSTQGTKGFQEASDELLKIGEEVDAATLKHNQLVHDARLKDLQDAQSYTQQLRSIYASVIDIVRETAGIELRELEGNYLRRDELIRKQAALDKAAEAERSRRAISELSDRRRVLDLERQIIAEAGANPKEQVNLIAAIDRQIEAEKRKSAAIQIDIDRQAQDQIKQKWVEIAGDLSKIVGDAFKGGWKSVLQDFIQLLDQLSSELLNSAFLSILGQPQKGSSAGGIVGSIANLLISSIFGGIGKGSSNVSSHGFGEIFGGSRAGGGDARVGYLYETHGLASGKEWFIPTVPGHIFNQQQVAGAHGGTIQHVYNLHFETKSSNSHYPLRSESEFAEGLVNFMRKKLR